MFYISTQLEVIRYLGHTKLSLMDKRYEWKMTKPWNMKRFPLNTPVIHYTRILLWPMKDLLVQDMLYGDHISFSPQWDTGHCCSEIPCFNDTHWYCIAIERTVSMVNSVFGGATGKSTPQL